MTQQMDFCWHEKDLLAITFLYINEVATVHAWTFAILNRNRETTALSYMN